jgi:hypothetical protein
LRAVQEKSAKWFSGATKKPESRRSRGFEVGVRIDVSLASRSACHVVGEFVDLAVHGGLRFQSSKFTGVVRQAGEQVVALVRIGGLIAPGRADARKIVKAVCASGPKKSAKKSLD